MSGVRVLRFWKPYQVLTKFSPDAAGRATLAEYVDVEGVYAAGRLDYDSEGLLLLTDSGTLIRRLTDPAFAHPRTYLVQVERVPDGAALDRLRNGVLLRDGRTRPAAVRLLDPPPDLPERPVPIRHRKSVPTAWLEMTLAEGRNRQVRRMTAAVGHPALRLVRWAIGPVTLAGLSPGEWRFLDAAAVQALRQSAFQQRRPRSCTRHGDGPAGPAPGAG